MSLSGLTRDTSIESYNAIRESGGLSERRWAVYDFIYARADAQYRWVDLKTGTASRVVCGGSISRADVQRFFKDLDDSYGPRIRELEVRGLIRFVGCKIDPISEKRCRGYRTTDMSHPVPVAQRRLSPSDALRRAVADMEAMHSRLRNKNSRLARDLAAALHYARTRAPILVEDALL